MFKHRSDIHPVKLCFCVSFCSLLEIPVGSNSHLILRNELAVTLIYVKVDSLILLRYFKPKLVVSSDLTML